MNLFGKRVFIDMIKFKLSNKIIPNHIQMGSTSNDKRSLVRSDKRQKGKYREREGHVKTRQRLE